MPAPATTGMTSSLARVALVTAGLLAIPWLAMRWGAEGVLWTAQDFIVAGALLFATGAAWQLAVRTMADRMYRLATGMALGSMLALVWVNLAVGLIGSENNRANLMYLGVLGVGAIGAALARLQPRGMAWTFVAAAAAQALVALIALLGDLGGIESGPRETILANGFFVAWFLAAAGLFWRAARAPVRIGRPAP